MGELIKGAPVAEAIREEIKADVEMLRAKGIAPKLAFIRVGAQGPDLAYERGATKTMGMCEIDTEVVELPEDITEEAYIEKLKEINAREDIHGILTFRPLPKHIRESVVKHVIDPAKDVDCFNPINMATVVEGDDNGFFPCTPAAVIEILDHYKVDLEGKNVTVIGHSNVVGKPVSLLLLNRNATVTTCHIFTKDTASMTKGAVIVVSAAGVPALVKPEQVDDGVVVIDVGINFVDGKMCGDVDPAVADKAGMMTPVPGGVGAVTNTVLAKHVVIACKRQNNL